MSSPVNHILRPVSRPLPKRQLLALLVVLITILLIASVAMPNLLRSRIAADEASRLARLRQAGHNGLSTDDDSIRQVVQTAAMEIVAKDVPSAMEQITVLPRTEGGWVEQSTLMRRDQGSFASVTVRVPSARLEEVRSAVRRIAQRTDGESLKASDVTVQTVDLDSNLRNARAEEQQLLVILVRATTVKDTLDVAQRLSEVRGRIESLDGRRKLLSQQVAMASLTVNISAVPSVQALWRPGEELSQSVREGLQGLADYAGIMLAFLLRLPSILLWIATVVLGITITWRGARWYWRRFVAQPLQG